MVLITYTVTVSLTFISTVATTCLFIPDDSLTYVDFFISPDMTNECINANTSVPFIFTGVTHVRERETFIGVKRITVSIFNEKMYDIT